MKSANARADAEATPSTSNQIEASIQEQIIQQMLEGLKDKPEFPIDLQDSIKNLGERGQLQKPTEVMKAVKSSPGGFHAAA